MSSNIRILFVDDESFVLQGIRRMLWNMRKEWEMDFVESAKEALAHFEQKEYDVIVSDMRMPVMNGAELLNAVMEKYPNTIRFILSGHSDQDLIMQCVGSTHQYLAKPCEAEQLKAAIARATRLRNSLHNEELSSLISSIDNLPTIPALYTQVVDRLKSPDAALEDIAELVSQDFGMTAKILKLVNNAFFGLGQKISTVHEALNYLGLDTLKTLILVVDTFGQYETSLPGPLSMEALWSHSMQTASFAKTLCAEENTGRAITDQAFLAGMFHDIGKLILAASDPERYKQVLERGKDTTLDQLQVEQAIFGGSHADVGGYVLGLWGLPTPVVEAISCHHKPSVVNEHSFSPLTAVHLANVISNQSMAHSLFAPPQFDMNYLESLKLSDKIEHYVEILQSS